VIVTTLAPIADSIAAELMTKLKWREIPAIDLDVIQEACTAAWPKTEPPDEDLRELFLMMTITRVVELAVQSTPDQITHKEAQRRLVAPGRPNDETR